MVICRASIRSRAFSWRAASGPAVQAASIIISASDYIEKLCFDEEDIAYLRGKNCFCPEFLEYLKTFRFTGDIWAVPEGRRNGEAAPVGDVAEENVKIADLLVHFRLKISVAHGELVEKENGTGPG